MPGESDAEELRALQRKAYGPGGGSTDAEAQRLRELEDALRPRSAASIEVAEAVDSAGASTAAPTESAAPDPPPIPPDDTAAVPTSLRSVLGLRRRQGLVVAVASLLLLAMGVGAGWALFRHQPTELALTQEQQQRRIELSADAEFDAGSVQALAEDHGALAWYATKDGGETSCLVIDIGERSQQHCTDDLDSGLTVSMPVPRESDTAGVVRSENVFASLLRSTTGEPIVQIQSWESEGSLLAHHEGEERVRAEALVAEGFDLGLAIIGYFRGQPVWLGDRLSDDSAPQKCLIVDAANAIQCAGLDDALESGLESGMVEVDTTSGEVTRTTAIDVHFTPWLMPLLTITEDIGFSGLVVPGDSVVVDAPPGDPIEVTVPSRPEG